MSLYGLLKIKQEPSLHDIEDAFDGNLCRCTGNWAYNKIIFKILFKIRTEQNPKRRNLKQFLLFCVYNLTKY